MDNNETTNESSVTVDSIIALFGHASSGSIDPVNLLEGLPSGTEQRELKRLREWAISKGCAAKDFDGAARKWRLKMELGRVPQHERDFVAAYAESRNIRPRFDGSLTVPGDQADFAIDYSRVKLARDASLANARLRAGFDKTLIGAAIDQWIDSAKRDYLAAVWSHIDNSVASRCPDEWRTLIEAFVDTGSVSADYAIAVLRKFIWQVKRKMKGLPITSHLMPVLSGPQGNGKSTLVAQILREIEGCERRVNFNEITDGRNIEMWSSYVLFTDEMEKAAKADIEAIKNVITSPTLSRRILGTGSMVQISQCATFIGATNGSLGSSIRDTTGLRRFAPIPTLHKPGRPGRTVDWEEINRTDFAALWRSVQIDDPDPMTEHIKELEGLQEDEREKSPVELWLDGLDLSSISQWDCAKDGSIKADRLFERFRDFERDHFPGVFRLSSQAWGREMKRLLDLDPAGAKFTRKRSGDGWRYLPCRPIAPVQDRVVELHDSLRLCRS